MKIIVTGSAGSFGSAFSHGMGDVPGAKTIGVDELSRRGAAANLVWFNKHSVDHVFEQLDVTSASDMDDLLGHHPDADAVVHVSAHSAVTSSVTDTRHDRDTSARGTLNANEAVRPHTPGAALLFSSTNKVVEWSQVHCWRSSPPGRGQTQEGAHDV
jgi:CDP-paratose 2-epimerase